MISKVLILAVLAIVANVSCEVATIFHPPPPIGSPIRIFETKQYVSGTANISQVRDGLGIIPGSVKDNLPASFAVDPANKRYVFYLSTTNTQYTYANGSYQIFTGRCWFDPSATYDAEVARHRSVTKIQSVLGIADMYSGLTVDAAVCEPSRISFTAVVGPFDDTLKQLVFAQKVPRAAGTVDRNITVLGTLNYPTFSYRPSADLFQLDPLCYNAGAAAAAGFSYCDTFDF
eukprot:TRINITY_DN277_c0_g1_i4.p1 TRINITY_DN277_c0_g1~~TRINITY_DN277_c0_g1_i4.p1  ORF type:complete len:267 (+),score=58.10 TRINITY_DN277_c0_g1_i4:110-802(+)